MSDLTRRRFLTGAPAAAVAAVVGLAGAAVARAVPPTVPVITSDDSAQRMYNYWRSAQTEYIALSPKLPFWIWIDHEGRVTTWSNPK